MKNDTLTSVCVPSDILVPAGRSGAKVQESDLLHAGVHRAAVSMCQPLLPQRQVKARATARTNKGRHGLDGKKHVEGLREGPKKINELITLT